MSFEWYVPKKLDLADLEPLGVRMMPAEGQPIAYLDPETGSVMIQVGEVTAYPDGRVYVWPRIGVLPWATRALLTSAEDGVLGRTGTWYRRRTKHGAYRRCTVCVRAGEGDAMAMALRAAVALPEMQEQARDRVQSAQDVA